MRKTYKYRLNPTKSQRTRLNQTLEHCRWVYNETLAMRKNAWEQERKNVSYYDTKRMIPIWKQQKPELKNVHSQVLQNVTERVDLAFKAFFRRVKTGPKNGYPRFKGYNRYDSFTYPQGGFALLDNDRLRLSKIGEVKIRLHRPIEGTVKTLTLQRDKLGNWYACFSCLVEPKPWPVSSDMVGIDMGLSKFATFSTGESIPNPRFLKRDENDLKRIQRKVSKLDKGTAAHRQAIKTLNHVYTRIKNRRTNFAHQESRKLVNRFGLIVFEKLDIQEMQHLPRTAGAGSSGNHRINKSIGDVAWGQFVQFTNAKAVEAGRAVVLVDPRNTTQCCSGCGSIVKKDLSVRVHNCPDCGLVLNRDYNAALNILARGLAGIGNQSVEAHV